MSYSKLEGDIGSNQTSTTVQEAAVNVRRGRCREAIQDLALQAERTLKLDAMEMLAAGVVAQELR